MKSKQLFWGVLFLTLGVVYLLIEVMNVHIVMGKFYHFWPVSLILIGLTVLSKNIYAKQAFSASGGLIFALVIYSFFARSWIPRDNWHEGDDKAINYSTSELFTESFDRNIKNVHAAFKLGAGRIEIHGDDSSLVTVKSGGMKNLFTVDANKQDENYDFEVSMRHVHLNLKDDNHGKLEVGFNNKPNYSFNFELGAADVDLNLSSLKVQDIELSTGAASCNVDVKEFAFDTMNIKVEAGAASVRVRIPKDAGAQIIRETSLASTHFDGFKEVSEDIFQTENFSSAKKKIFIAMEGGVASFYVSRK